MAEEDVMVVETVLAVGIDTRSRADVLEGLGENGCIITFAETGKEALIHLRSHSFDIILLDLDLPDLNGLDIGLIIKSDPMTSHTPVFMLVGEETDDRIVMGIDYGIDDYIKKPVYPKLLRAKILSFLKKAPQRLAEESSNSITITLNPAGRSARVRGHTVDLTSTEFSILNLLIKNSGITCTRKQIMERLKISKDNQYKIKERSIDVHISSLRRKFGVDGLRIKSVYSIGYRIE